MHKLIFFITSGLFIFILWIIYMANTGQSTIFFNFVMSTPYGDKLGHVFLFGFLTLGANISTRLKLVKVGNGNIFLGSLLVTLFVLIEEFSQNYLHTRTLDALDLFADAIGIITFSIISFYIRKKYFETTSKEYS